MNAEITDAEIDQRSWDLIAIAEFELKGRSVLETLMMLSVYMDQ